MSEINEYTHFHKPVKKFDDGVHLDTGEIDPDTGDRIVDIAPDVFTSFTNNDNRESASSKDFACKFCGQDPCSTDCAYR
jgi:hypothetical protein